MRAALRHRSSSAGDARESGQFRLVEEEFDLVFDGPVEVVLECRLLERRGEPLREIRPAGLEPQAVGLRQPDPRGTGRSPRRSAAGRGSTSRSLALRLGR
ncbi:hypothetical protein ACFPN7_21590 [Amycolatopsis halotolerans]|uniref:hypothetical protein n=1 Tax=Amycolatopsis halotolerans TaxID=330083 RepID=UPI0036167DD1